MIECQIKDLSIQKGNFIYIPYALQFQVTCLEALASRKRHLGFFFSEHWYYTFKFMIIASSTNLIILFWQARQVLSGHVMKRNLVNWSFHIVKNSNLSKTVYITSRYTPVGRNFSKIIFFEVGWPVIW